MFRVLKYLLYLVLLAAIGLVVYAYLGPILGADFSPPVETRSVPVELSLDQ
ncbi:MAG: hypothetical protein ACU0DW_04525 [Shimia sp.]